MPACGAHEQSQRQRQSSTSLFCIVPAGRARAGTGGAAGLENLTSTDWLDQAVVALTVMLHGLTPSRSRINKIKNSNIWDILHEL